MAQGQPEPDLPTVTNVDPLAGRTLANEFRLVRLLGRGGMGSVYLAEQLSLKRTVALKLLPVAATSEGTAVERFQREAVAAAHLQHPNIVQVHFFGQHEGQYFIAMEFVDGEPLNSVLKREEKLPPSRVAAIGRDAARALAAAHKQGFVHRDVKPENIFVARDGTVKLGDFGLARDMSSDGGSLSVTGQVMGTPYYMPPEQVKGLKVDPRADLYALGATMFHLLTGRPPYGGTTLLEILNGQLFTPVPQPFAFGPGVPMPLVALVRKMLAKAPEQRPATAEEVATACEQVLAAPAAPPARQAGKPPSRTGLPAVRPGGKPPTRTGIPAVAAKPRATKKSPLLVISLCAGALVIAVGTWAMTKRHDDPPKGGSPGGSAASTPSPTDPGPSDRPAAPPDRQVFQAYMKQSEVARAQADGSDAASDWKKVKDLAETAKGKATAPDDVRAAETLLALATMRRDWADARAADAAGNLSEAIRLATLAASATGVEGAGDVAKYLQALQARGAEEEQYAAHMQAYRDAFAKGDMESADAWLAMVLKARPRDPAALAEQAKMDDRRAKAAFDVAMAAGKAHESAGEWKLAKESYDAALAARAGDADAKAGLARAMGQLGSADTLASGEAHAKAGEWDAALKDAEAVLAAKATDPQALDLAKRARAGAYKLRMEDGRRAADNRDWKGAKAAYDAALVLQPADKPALDASAKLEDLRQRDPFQFSLQYKVDLTEPDNLIWWATGVAFDPTGKLLAALSGTQENRAALHFIEAKTGKPLGKIPLKGSFPSAPAFSPDGKMLLWGGSDRAVHLADVRTMVETGKVTTMKGGIDCVGFHKNGRLVAAATHEFSLGVFDLGGKQVGSYPGRSFAFSPDGKLIAFANDKIEIRVVNLETGKEQAPLLGGAMGYWHIAWSPDGAWIGTCGFDGTARLWEAGTGKEVFHSSTGTHTIPCAFSPDSRVFVAGQMPDILMWDVKDPQKTCTIHPDQGKLLGLAFSPDGRLLASSGDNGTVKVWSAR